ncbi:unnamed protein product, partial [Symbiodinium sp. CCMP2592]
AVMGQAARSRVGRWLRAARYIKPEALKTPKMRQFADGYIFDNNYFVGNGEIKLGSTYAVKTLELLTRSPEIAVAMFQEKLCQPMKVVENWEKNMDKVFGKLFLDLPATARCLDHLQSLEGLACVRMCISKTLSVKLVDGVFHTRNIALHTAESPCTDCRDIADECNKLKHGDKTDKKTDEKKTASQAEAVDASDGVGGVASLNTVLTVGENESELPREVQAGCADYSIIHKCDFNDQAAVQDAVRKKWDKILISTDEDEFRVTGKSRIFPSWKVILMINAPTSRPPVVLKYISDAEKLAKACQLERYTIAVPVGKRYKLLSEVMTKFGEMEGTPFSV